MKNLMKLVSFALLAAACGGPLSYTPKPNPRAPEADSKVVADVKKDQGSTLLQVTIEHLAPPGRLHEGATTYVAWQRKNADVAWSRVGGLVYNEGDREGKIAQATVPETSFDLIVTAEAKPDPASPSPVVILDQHIN